VDEDGQDNVIDSFAHEERIGKPAVFCKPRGKRQKDEQAPILFGHYNFFILNICHYFKNMKDYENLIPTIYA
jgi:hypothetical protein